MIDKEHLEQTGLYALGLLEEHERTRFEQELRVNANLREALREVSAQTAAISLTVPQVPAPAGMLAGIERRLGLTKGRTQRVPALPGLRRFRISPAWGFAAALALLAGGLGVSSWRSSQRLTELEERLAKLDPAFPNKSSTASTQGSDNPDNNSGETDNAGAEGGPRGDRPRFIGDRTLRSMKLPPDVQRDLERLRSLEQNLQDGHDRDDPPAGVADLRIMEMYPPGVTPPARQERALLAARVAEAVAAAMKTGDATGDTPAPASYKEPAKAPDSQTADDPGNGRDEPTAPPPPLPPVLKGNGSSPNADIVIREGGTLNIPALNLHPDAHVVHENFPADTEFERYGLVRLDDTRVWDGHGGIWHHKGGTTYVGQKAPSSFQPPDPDDPGTVTVPPLRDAPQPEAAPVQPLIAKTPADSPTTAPPGQASSEPSATVAATANPLPYALPLIGSDGKGMIVTQNLAAPPAGSGYALWTSGANGATSLVGFLPPDAVNGVFAFDLAPGASIPAGFRITTQPLNQTATPGVSILQGP